jgi:hypothetical protein
MTSDTKENEVKSLDNGSNGLDKEILDFFTKDDGSNGQGKKKRWPRWITSHFKPKDLKILFKCSIAVWIMTLFIFINSTLRVIGQATFFGWYIDHTSHLSIN